MLLDLRDKVVLVTGAARGIGRVITEAFVRERSVVVGMDVTGVEWLGSALTAGGIDGAGYACDVRDNAGVMGEGLVEDLDDEVWGHCFDVNVGGVFRMCRAAVPVMKAQHSGRIINAASFAAVVPSIGSAAYAASKAAIVALTRTLAGELGPWDVTVNAYAPGMIPSGINTFAQLNPADQGRLLDTLTLRRWGEAEEVADLVCFLASDAARYITGTMVDVSGGKLATQFPQRAYELAGLR
jgi:3-oxoacyl-[acyl-carrier protein] reductase